MYQPIARTPLRRPGIFTGLALRASLSGLPAPSLAALPDSRIRMAISLASRLSRVFRLTLYAIRNFRGSDGGVAPQRGTKAAGP